jgi:hypothetical protein
MATFNREITKANFAAMADAELQSVISTGQDDYVPEAFELAKAEWDQRGMPAVVAVPRPVIGEPPKRSLAWLDVYAALMGMGGVGNPIAAALRGEPALVVSSRAVVGAFAIALAVGLRHRQRWAWWLNWLALAAVWAPFTNWRDAAVVAAVWLVPNAIYFARRKGSFGPGALHSGTNDPAHS